MVFCMGGWEVATLFACILPCTLSVGEAVALCGHLHVSVMLVTQLVVTFDPARYVCRVIIAG